MKLSTLYLESNRLYEDFFMDFFSEFKKFPFGSMPKRDLDCLIFHLLEKYNLAEGKTNREKAYNLNISETKLKSYIVDSNAKYGKRCQEESVSAIILKIEGGTKVLLEGDCIVFFEENPVVKADFIQALKDEGFYTDTSFNKEIIKVRAASFLAFSLSKKLLNTEKLLEILNSGKTEKEKIKEFENTNKSAKEIMADIFEILKKQEKFNIKTFIELFSYGKEVSAAKVK